MMLSHSKDVHVLLVCLLRVCCTMLLLGSLVVPCLLSPGVWAADELETPALGSWALPVEDVVHHPPGHLMLVDVRPAQAFAQFHIPGSLHVPLFAVSSKAFLRSSPIILLDEGYRPGRLQQACEQLRQAGFEARYLAGGLNAWNAAGQPLQGDVFAQRHLHHVPPQAVWEEQQYDTWLVIDVTGEITQYDREQTPDNRVQERLQRTSCPYSEEDPTFLLCLEEAVMTRSDRPEMFILFTNEDGSGYPAIARQLHESLIPHIWYLHGGLQAYRMYIDRQARIRQGSAHENTACTSVSGCLPCNQ